jgi:hypothetical protein
MFASYDGAFGVRGFNGPRNNQPSVIPTESSFILLFAGLTEVKRKQAEACSTGVHGF